MRNVMHITACPGVIDLRSVAFAFPAQPGGSEGVRN